MDYLGSIFFPFFNSFLRIFPPPISWSPWAAGVLVTVACLFIKLVLQTYCHDMNLDLDSVKLAGGGFVLFLFMHYQLPLPEGANDVALNLFIYGGLFACPTFAFTAMQLRKKSQSHPLEHGYT
ncbi:MAG: hypothetical protein Q7T21_15085 [Gallionella sp.]|nr:hypothetical protein [Gallionella sp.]